MIFFRTVVTERQKRWAPSMQGNHVSKYMSEVIPRAMVPNSPMKGSGRSWKTRKEPSYKSADF